MITAVVKKDCPTCQLVEPVLGELASRGVELTVHREDDDSGLEASYRLGVETVPTLIKDDQRIVGWSREQWEAFTGIEGLGRGLPDYRPGCGAKAVEPDVVARFVGATLKSRRVTLADAEDDAEAMFERGWTDGLPVVPPTERRVARMLEGTRRRPDDIVAVDPARLGRVHGREGRGECGHGRL